MSMDRPAGSDARPGRAGMGVSPKMIGTAVLALLALIFVFQNTDSRKVTFLFWDFDAATWLWLLVVFVAGMIVGWMLARFGRNRS
ncbi:MAG: lipopolysaccharide assembly protein LapA domain-containing protein [Acidimicrobiia bacterium]